MTGHGFLKSVAVAFKDVSMSENVGLIFPMK